MNQNKQLYNIKKIANEQYVTTKKAGKIGLLARANALLSNTGKYVRKGVGKVEDTLYGGSVKSKAKAKFKENSNYYAPELQNAYQRTVNSTKNSFKDPGDINLLNRALSRISAARTKNMQAELRDFVEEEIKRRSRNRLVAGGVLSAGGGYALRGSEKPKNDNFLSRISNYLS